MKLASRSLLVAAVCATAFLSFCGAAGAEIMTIGAPLDGGAWTSKSCESAGCAFLNNYGRAPSPGVPPIWPNSIGNGVIVRLNVAGATTPGTLRVRTMGSAGPLEGPFVSLFKTASAPIAVVPSAGVQTYPMSMPVTRGDEIGLSMSHGTSIGFLEGEGFFSAWESDPPEAGPSKRDGEGTGLVGFNVEIQPPPAISYLSTAPIPPLTASTAPTGGGATAPPFAPTARAAGPTAGGTKVYISGGNFEGASSVMFGSVPATSFTVVSGREVDAIAPPSATAVATPVSVTTIAGTATSRQGFEYFVPPVLCTVPALKGKSLKAARRALVAAHCGLGTVTKRAGAKTKSGKVVRQSKAPGSQFASGGKIDVTLRPPKTSHHEGGKR